MSSGAVVLNSLALLGGLAILVRSADWFVDGAAGTARVLGLPPLIIGMLVVGFGTSAPEMLISGISAADGASGIALGNAWGSNIANIALILGVSAMVHPVAVQSRILLIELPILVGATVIGALLVIDGVISRPEALILLVAMLGFVFWSIRTGKTHGDDPLAGEFSAAEEGAEAVSSRTYLFRLLLGLVLLIVSSRIMVWGAVGIATALGVSDLVIGLTIVALGTSLPELASSVAAARRGEHDLILGNVIGSNLFNTLAVVGVGAVINPIDVEPVVLVRDLPVMAALTLVLFVIGFRVPSRHPQGGGATVSTPGGRVNRFEAALLLLTYAGYLIWVALSLRG